MIELLPRNRKLKTEQNRGVSWVIWRASFWTLKDRYLTERIVESRKNMVGVWFMIH